MLSFTWPIHTGMVVYGFNSAPYEFDVMRSINFYLLTYTSLPEFNQPFSGPWCIYSTNFLKINPEFYYTNKRKKWRMITERQLVNRALEINNDVCLLETLVLYLALELSCHCLVTAAAAAAASVCRNHQSLSDRHLQCKHKYISVVATYAGGNRAVTEYDHL